MMAGRNDSSYFQLNCRLTSYVEREIIVWNQIVPLSWSCEAGKVVDEKVAIS
ncbi:MAG: hypothetical protein K0Q94_949 [Paenibacillus sp.]|nr:hypothetical protein [Paenibacillus sp.]